MSVYFLSWLLISCFLTCLAIENPGLRLWIGESLRSSRRRPLTFWKSGKIRDLDASSQPQRCWVGKKSFEQHFNTILGDLLEDPNANPNSGILKSTTANTQMLKVSFAAIASPPPLPPPKNNIYGMRRYKTRWIGISHESVRRAISARVC
nr:PREDICTED: uncharacterized protein LOC108953205 [Musa acuminata subsp. malaccensis]